MSNWLMGILKYRKKPLNKDMEEVMMDRIVDDQILLFI